MNSDILVSIVSGTYNRFGYLKKMISSVRSSVGVGIPYEIVLVDGGSTDGTINWCKSQSDIVLIEQGKLLGAVTAFNAGFARATGKYVIIGNDDIEFMNEAIYGAIAFMETRPDVGIGCFCQDRGGKEFHIENMPAVKDGRQVSVPYGQVCIINRQLGNLVGWWGKEYHTYAGDNELSCNVYEQGYRVEIIEPCCCVHDYVAKDDLRITNMGSVENHPSSGHPDSNAWVKKWTRDGLLGPRIPAYYMNIGNPKRVSRVLYAPIYDPGVNTELQRKTKFGLREALSRQFHVLETDYYSNYLKLFDDAEMWKPDIFILQIQDAKLVNKNHIKHLQNYNRKALFVNWNGDFHPEHILDPAYVDMMTYFDLSTFVTTFMEEEYAAAKVNWKYWQIGFETLRDETEGIPRANTPAHDVLLLGNGYHAERIRLGEFLRKLKCDVGIYGSWPKHVKTNGMNIYDFAEGTRLYKNCKIAISDARIEAPGFVSNRFFQALAAGAFLLQQKIGRFEELTGLIDGVHYVEWTDLDDLRNKILYYSSNDHDRIKIAKAGYKEAHKNHSFDARVRELMEMMRTENYVYYTKSGES